MEELPLEQMLPRVILVREYDTVQMRHKVAKRISEYYELSFFTESSGTMIIQGAQYPITRGSIRFSPPGTTLSGIPNFRCITVYFDFGDARVYHNPILDGIPAFFETPGAQRPLFEALLTAYRSEQITAKLRQNQLLLDLLATLFEETRSQDTYCDTVHQCIRYLRSHFSENVTLETLGALTGYSGLHLMRLFVRDTGRTPHKWLTAIRLLHARQLLTETEKNLDQIASECGFSSVSHFKTLFKESNACSPGTYRKNARQS